MNIFSSQQYWENRYKQGGTSGKGSQGHLLEFKAQVINNFIKKRGIVSVIDFGCGDGELARQLCCDVYLGYDVSPTVVMKCRECTTGEMGKFFYQVKSYCGETADLALSIDVIFHLVEEQVFDEYMRRLFCAADHYVIIYSSNNNENERMSEHVRHRRFTEWVKVNRPQWDLFGFTKNAYSFYDGDPNGSFCDFYFYKKREGTE